MISHRYFQGSDSHREALEKTRAATGMDSEDVEGEDSYGLSVTVNS